MSERNEIDDRWCRVCGSLHGPKDCPGEFLATGPERYGWRLLAHTPHGPEVYGTLVAPCGARWRARVLTFPNILWVVPHGGTIKFFADTPAAAENEAVAYVKEHCRKRGYNLGKEVPSVEGGEIDLEQDEATTSSPAVRASQRRIHTVSIRYGVSRPEIPAQTEDLSETGLFIRTNAPLPVGTNLQMFLDIEGFGLPLRGVVCWLRDKDEDGGRVAGMGLKLISPHPRYVHYCRQTYGTHASRSTTEIEPVQSGAAKKR